jgi:hypothetical protein
VRLAARRMIWRTILVIVGVPAAVVVGLCSLWLLFVTPALLIGGYFGWVRRDLAVDYATLPVLLLAGCAAIGVVVRLVVSRLDDEVRSTWWVSYWWRRLWRSPR